MSNTYHENPKTYKEVEFITNYREPTLTIWKINTSYFLGMNNKQSKSASQIQVSRTCKYVRNRSKK
jgi:hypothetical protein